MAKRRKVLLLGANGKVGRGFIEEYMRSAEYQKSYELILGVHKKGKAVKGFKLREVKLETFESVKGAVRGIDVIIHLAANPNPDAEFKDLVKPNIHGVYHVFEAARMNKCSRVIFASSIHAIQGYGHGYEVRFRDAPRPIDLYGATKAFGEALCHTYFSKYGISCLAIRIGAYTSNDTLRNVCFSRHDYDHVISQRDMGQLIHKCIIAPAKTKYGILSGISKNKKRDMDLRYARRLVGYKPVDDSYKICKHVKIEG